METRAPRTPTKVSYQQELLISLMGLRGWGDFKGLDNDCSVTPYVREESKKVMQSS